MRHYGFSDLAIANGLRAFIKRRGHWVVASNYLQALKRVAHLSDLRSCCGLQTYIGCSFVGGELRLTHCDILDRSEIRRLLDSISAPAVAYI